MSSGDHWRWKLEKQSAKLLRNRRILISAVIIILKLGNEDGGKITVHIPGTKCPEKR